MQAVVFTLVPVPLLTHEAGDSYRNIELCSLGLVTEIIWTRYKLTSRNEFFLNVWRSAGRHTPH